jgi:hypothetical protein
MALQTFTAGQVLTAAQVTALQANDYNQTVNNYTDSRVLTIADLGDRVVMNKATATTITVNTGIFAAGDTLWIHNIGAGVCTITAGTATVSTSGSLALAQNSGGTLYFTSTGVAIFFPTVAASAQGLTLINTSTFSGVSSQSISDIFSTTYNNYRVYLTTGDPATNQPFTMRLRVSGADNSSSNYYRMNFGQGTAGSTSLIGAAQTSFGLGFAGTGSNFGAAFDVLSPFDSTLRTTINGLGVSNNGTYNGITGWTLNNWFDATTSFTGFTLLFGANTTGSVSVYGVNK